MSLKLGNIAILNTKSSDCRNTISEISKNETINVMQNADVNGKSKTIS